MVGGQEKYRGGAGVCLLVFAPPGDTRLSLYLFTIIETYYSKASYLLLAF